MNICAIADGFQLDQNGTGVVSQDQHERNIHLQETTERTDEFQKKSVFSVNSCGKRTSDFASTLACLFVERRAPNYPGSTYTLTYDREHDQLRGIYFQAVQQQSFNVYFVRMK